jgi:hypothetical protein
LPKRDIFGNKNPTVSIYFHFALFYLVGLEQRDFVEMTAERMSGWEG